MIDERTKHVRKVAKLLAVDDGDVLQLLDDGRLAGVLVDALTSRGMRATPSATSKPFPRRSTTSPPKAKPRTARIADNSAPASRP